MTEKQQIQIVSQANVVIERHEFEKILFWGTLAPDWEFSGFGLVALNPKTQTFHVYKVFMVEQEGKAYETELIGSASTQAVVDVHNNPKYGPDVAREHFRVWWHWHHKIPANYSAQDDATLTMLGKNGQRWWLGIVVNADQEVQSVLFNPNDGGLWYKGVPTRIASRVQLDKKKEWLKEFNQNVKRVTYSSGYGPGQTTGFQHDTSRRWTSKTVGDNKLLYLPREVMERYGSNSAKTSTVIGDPTSNSSSMTSSGSVEILPDGGVQEVKPDALAQGAFLKHVADALIENIDASAIEAELDFIEIPQRYEDCGPLLQARMRDVAVAMSTTVHQIKPQNVLYTSKKYYKALAEELVECHFASVMSGERDSTVADLKPEVAAQSDDVIDVTDSEIIDTSDETVMPFDQPEDSFPDGRLAESSSSVTASAASVTVTAPSRPSSAPSNPSPLVKRTPSVVVGRVASERSDPSDWMR